MKKERSLLRYIGIFVIIAIVSIYGVRVQGVQKMSDVTDEERADIITIDSIKVFGDLERSEVAFLHDKHTDTLEKKNKDCMTCHLSEKDRLVFKFKRLQDTDRQTVMDIYHANCIECHKDTIASKEKSGPVVCGECHKEKQIIISSRQPMGFDKSLHFRHLKAHENKCEKCHHEYDQKTKKLFYAKEKEDTCRYCHRKETQENRISMQQASHLSCIDCHSKNLANKKETGPVKCSGCHDLKAQRSIKKVDLIPRMERKQPDIVFIKTGIKKDEEKLAARMNPVPFNHKKHEEYNDTCRVCHHESLKSCNECHTLTESKEGKNVKLEQAMHQISTSKSCLGCHEVKQNDKNCSGCHAFMKKIGKQDSSCLNCHMTPLPESTTASSSSDDSMIASMLLNSKESITETFIETDIPEKVFIKDLAKKYDSVEMPHRKIVKTLVENISENKLASFFHTQKGTVCQGCHHNSPVAKKPPRCGSCHGKPFDEKDLFKPGLMGAYHRQCMKCHVEMEIEKPDSRDCTGCHVEKK